MINNPTWPKAAADMAKMARPKSMVRSVRRLIGAPDVFSLVLPGTAGLTGFVAKTPKVDLKAITQVEEERC